MAPEGTKEELLITLSTLRWETWADIVDMALETMEADTEGIMGRLPTA